MVSSVSSASILSFSFAKALSAGCHLGLPVHPQRTLRFRWGHWNHYCALGPYGPSLRVSISKCSYKYIYHILFRDSKVFKKSKLRLAMSIFKGCKSKASEGIQSSQCLFHRARLFWLSVESNSFLRGLANSRWLGNRSHDEPSFVQCHNMSHDIQPRAAVFSACLI